MELFDVVRRQAMAALWECCPADVIGNFERNALNSVLPEIEDDLKAYAQKDSASRGDPCLIAAASTSFKAVLHYRIARALLACPSLDDTPPHAHAWMVSSRGKWLSGAEIHPECMIGRRFVLDHGVGTVIGASAVIGDDCYLLGGVVVGARGIASNSPGPRHPRLGHRVQVGAFAQLLGPIRIGNDVVIGANCMISEDIPDACRVTLTARHQQVRRAASDRVRVDGIQPVVEELP